MKNELTAKSTDPTIVASATTYSGKVVRMVHVFSDEGLAENAEHWFEDNGGKKENEQQQKYYL